MFGKNMITIALYISDIEIDICFYWFLLRMCEWTKKVKTAGKIHAKPNFLWKRSHILIEEKIEMLDIVPEPYGHQSHIRSIREPINSIKRIVYEHTV